MMSEAMYLHDPIFEEKRRRWNAERLKEQREISKILGLPEPSAVLTPREAEITFGKGPSRKTAPSAVIPIKAPVSNPFRRLASKGHRQNLALRQVISGSPAPTPAPEPAKSKSVKIGGLVFAGSVTETIEGAGR